MRRLSMRITKKLGALEPRKGDPVFWSSFCRRRKACAPTGCTVRGSTFITFTAFSPVGWTIFLDKVTATPAAANSTSCITSMQPPPPFVAHPPAAVLSSPPPNMPPPAGQGAPDDVMTTQKLSPFGSASLAGAAGYAASAIQTAVATGIATSWSYVSGASLGVKQSMLVRVRGSTSPLGPPVMTMLVIGSSASPGAASQGSAMGGTFCGMTQSGARVTMLESPASAAALLSGLGNGTLPFTPGSMALISALESAAKTAASQSAIDTRGEVLLASQTQVWVSDGAGGYAAALRHDNLANSGSTVRLCAVFGGVHSRRRLRASSGPVVVSDSGTVQLSTSGATYPPPGRAVTPPSYIPPAPNAPGAPPKPPAPPPPKSPPPKPPTPPTPPSPPPSSLMSLGSVNYASGGTSAFNYANEVFRCAQPSLQLITNTSHALIKLSSWAEVQGDVPDTDTVDQFNAGRGRAVWGSSHGGRHFH